MWNFANILISLAVLGFVLASLAKAANLKIGTIAFSRSEMVSIKDLFILYGRVIFFLKVCSFIVFFRLSVLWRVPGHYFSPRHFQGEPLVTGLCKEIVRYRNQRERIVFLYTLQPLTCPHLLLLRSTDDRRTKPTRQSAWSENNSRSIQAWCTLSKFTIPIQAWCTLLKLDVPYPSSMYPIQASLTLSKQPLTAVDKQLGRSKC